MATRRELDLISSTERPPTSAAGGRVSKPVAVALSLGLLALIAWFDWTTGPDIRYSLLYVIPVLLTAWFAGGKAGVAMSILSASVRLLVVLKAHGAPARLWTAYWNTAVRLACFLAASVLLSAFKDLRDHLESLVVERTHSLRRLGAQLSETEALERRRLAHDIHDDFGQTLTALKLNLAAAVADGPVGAPRQARAADAMVMVSDLIQRCRSLTFDLHPTMLEHLGFTATLRHFAAEFTRHTGVETIVNEEGAPWRLPEMAAGYLFRSVKELAGNAAKHGHAKEVVVSVYWSPRGLRVVVDDDGGGCNPSDLLSSDLKGLGLAGIRERLLAMGGTVRPESELGQGARVALELPRGGEEVQR